MKTAVDLYGRNLLTLNDYSSEEISYLIDLAADLKTAKREGWEEQSLAGKEIALIFDADSIPARWAFEVAAHDQGARVTMIGLTATRMSDDEAAKDVARVLGGTYDAVECRGLAEAAAAELAARAGIPVYNRLSDEGHPSQILSDFLTFDEHLDKPLDELAFCYLGGARLKMADTYLVCGARLGMDVRIASPRPLWPPQDVVAMARRTAKLRGGHVTVTEDVHEAVAGCDVLLGDAGTSMGEPAEAREDRLSLLPPYRVSAETLKLTGNPDVKFMRRSPALDTRHGLEAPDLTDDVPEASPSLVLDDAENRIHAIKAVLVATLTN